MNFPRNIPVYPTFATDPTMTPEPESSPSHGTDRPTAITPEHLDQPWPGGVPESTASTATGTALAETPDAGSGVRKIPVKKFIIMRADRAAVKVGLGETVYDHLGPTWGCTREDEQHWGVPVVAVTKEVGGAFFTIPREDLSEIPPNETKPPTPRAVGAGDVPPNFKRSGSAFCSCEGQWVCDYCEHHTPPTPGGAGDVDHLAVACGECGKQETVLFDDNGEPVFSECRHCKPTEPGESRTDAAKNGSAALLRAMAHNYGDRHNWDHLDKEACESAAALIDSLKRELADARAEVAAQKRAVSDLVLTLIEARSMAELALNASRDACANALRDDPATWSRIAEAQSKVAVWLASNSPS